ncbi:MAG TPA: phosphoribosylanthranilate isomerase [Candidatus Polarisedimenticolaceae bacterium]
MKRVVVKVCGITEERDAIEAVHLGVDALGFNFWKESPRYVEPTAVRRMVDKLPALVHKVGVFVNDPLIRVLEVAREAGLTAIQFHGDEVPSLCAAVAPMPWIKAVRVGADFDPESLSRYATTTYLLDGHRDGAYGGTGAVFEWRRARAWSVYGNLVIAGGLDPQNVAMAIEDARPYGVDVASGVEILPGKKDLDRLELFVEAVRRAERRIAQEAGA